MAFQAAGFKGPFTPYTKTVSIGCLIGVISGVKTFIGGGTEAGVRAVPPVARYFGAGEEAASAAGASAGIISWTLAILAYPIAVDSLLGECECKDGTR